MRSGAITIELDLGEILKALADPTRRRIVTVLLRHGVCVSELARRLDITPAAVSQHLRLLQRSGLAWGEKRKNHVHYLIDREALCWAGTELAALADISRGSCPLACGSCSLERRREQ